MEVAINKQRDQPNVGLAYLVINNMQYILNTDEADMHTKRKKVSKKIKKKKPFSKNKDHLG